LSSGVKINALMQVPHRLPVVILVTTEIGLRYEWKLQKKLNSDYYATYDRCLSVCLCHIASHLCTHCVNLRHWINFRLFTAVSFPWKTWWC